MKKNVVLTLILLAVFAVPVWAGQWLTLTNHEYGFGLEYPDGWDTPLTDEHDLDDTILVLSKVEGGIPLIIVVAADSIPAEGGMEQALKTGIDDLLAEIESMGIATVEELDSGEIELNGIQAHYIFVSVSVMDMMYMQIDTFLIPLGENMVVINISGEENAYEEHAETIDRMLGSFRLLH